MFRWLSGGSAPVVTQVKSSTTDDPLATLDKRTCQLYTVSRSNPLFSDAGKAEYDTSGYQSQRSSQSNSNSPQLLRQPRLSHNTTCSVGEWRDLQSKSTAARTSQMTSESDFSISGVEGVADASIVEYTTVPPRPVWPPASHTTSGRSECSDLTDVNVESRITNASTLHRRTVNANAHHGQEASVAHNVARPRSVDFDLKEDISPRQQYYCRSDIARKPQMIQSLAPDSIVTDSLLVLMTPAKEGSRLPADSNIPENLREAANANVPVKPIGLTAGPGMLHGIHRGSSQPALPMNYGPDSLVTDSLLVLTRPREQVERQMNEADSARARNTNSNRTANTNIVTIGSITVNHHKTLIPVNLTNSEDKSQIIPRSASSSRVDDVPPPQNKSVRSSVSSDIGSVTSLLSAGSASTLIRRDQNISADPVAFVMRLWERTGLRTNGRKLLVGDPDRIYTASHVSPGCHSSTSDSQESDTSSSRSDSGGHRRPLSQPRLPISQGWLERVSVTSDELSATTTANLHQNRKYAQQSSTTSSTAYLNQVLPPAAASDSSHEYQSVICRQSSGSDGSESSGERRVTFSADTVDNENNSGRMRRLYESHRSLHAVPPPLPPPARLRQKSSARAPASPPRTPSVELVRELTLDAAALPRISGSKSDSGVVFRPITTDSHRPDSSQQTSDSDSENTWQPVSGPSRVEDLTPSPTIPGPKRAPVEKFRGGDIKRTHNRASTCRCLWILALLGTGVALFLAILIVFQWLMDPENQSHPIPQTPLGERRETTANVRQLYDIIS